MPDWEWVSKEVPEDDVVLLSAPELQAANTANPKKTKINFFICR
jgi:hypothetical protein